MIRFWNFKLSGAPPLLSFTLLRHEDNQMPKFSCPCGFVHNLSPCPHAGWVTVLDQQFETLVELEIARHQSGPTTPPINQYRAASKQAVDLLGHLYECPDCGRLMWCKPGPEKWSNVRIYVPEEHSRTGRDN